jgi:dolichyldiphosphatase
MMLSAVLTLPVRMPSTHSAAIAFYATYITFACFALPKHHSLLSIPLLRLAPLITTPWAATIIASRVWLGHHTWEQVAAGCAYGFCWSIIWFNLWTNGFDKIGSMIEQVVESYIREV